MRRLAVAPLAAVLVSCPVAWAAPPGAAWHDDREPGHAFVDVLMERPVELPFAGGCTPLADLPFDFAYFGEGYDRVSACADGRLVLQDSVTGRVAAMDVFAGVSAAPDTRVLTATRPDWVVYRWAGARAGDAPVTFEALLGRGGAVRFQFLTVAPYLAGAAYGRLGTIGLTDPRGGGRVEVMTNGEPSPGFDLRNGSVVDFDPGRLGGGVRPASHADPHCPPDPALPGMASDMPWCDRFLLGPDGVGGTADDRPDCLAGGIDVTPCTVSSTDSWAFDEGAYCRNCAYVFYVAVDCGADVHFPSFYDVEAMRLKVVDLATGLDVVGTLRNECAVRSGSADPLAYCDGCASGLDSIVPKDDAIPSLGKPAGSCDTIVGALSEAPCLATTQVGTDFAWGRPLDLDGDGSYDDDADGVPDAMDVPPCAPCEDPDCPCGFSTAANRVSEEQAFSVHLEREPTIAGVYRVEILSGGFRWDLFSNCDGTDVPHFVIHDSCAAALAAWNPLPELALDDDPDVAFRVVDDTSCPTSVRVAVTTCNRGGAAAPLVPFTITFVEAPGGSFDGDNANHPTDPACQASLAPGECRTCEWDVPLPPWSGPQLTAVVRIDDAFEVEECSESPDAVRCALARGRRTQAVGACTVTPLTVLRLARGAGSTAASWSAGSGVAAVDIVAGDLETLRRDRAYSHETFLACGLPPSPGPVVLDDPAGAGRGRYYLLGLVASDGASDYGEDSAGAPRPAPATAPPCR